jgi:excisionase family DNA binding protein
MSTFRTSAQDSTAWPESPSFYTVAEAADMFRMSEMTLYRAIRDGDFPAVRIRGRLIIPARAIDAIVDTAVDGGALVDARAWVDVGSPPDEVDRPRPGANQTGAGSPVTQQRARGEVPSMTYPRSVDARGSRSRRIAPRTAGAAR